MRASVMACVLLLSAGAACGKHGTTGTGDDDSTADAAGPAPAFSVQSTDLVIPAGQETTKCFYFHTPNTAMVPVTKWSSHMTPGSHHMIMFFGAATQPADGTIDEDCGIGGTSTAVPIWVYASQTPDQTLQIPTDDGTGTNTPLAQPIPPNQPAYFQMHYLNSTDTDLTVHVELSAYALDPSITKFTETDAFVTYNANITIGPDAVGVVATNNCMTPAGGKFWTVSTHSHKQSVMTDIKDNAGNTVFMSTDWEHPGATDWNPPTFYSFPGDNLINDCTYNNNDPTDPNHLTTIHDGPSAVTDEMCMATGYFFPATGAQFCLCTASGCFST